jgi:hypothetical protein
VSSTSKAIKGIGIPHDEAILKNNLITSGAGF